METIKNQKKKKLRAAKIVYKDGVKSQQKQHKNHKTPQNQQESQKAQKQKAYNNNVQITQIHQDSKHQERNSKIQT